MSVSRPLAAVALAIGVLAAGAPAHAQSSFTIGEKEVQAHGSIQQGFVFSDGNNFLTMNTSDGSGAMTDGAFNLASQLTPKLRVGGQIYSRNIGELGNGQLQVDWALADYKFGSAIGVRAGKVKTPLGLYNDTQDMEFLHTWALLPQGVYPLDLRSVTIAHVGADVYGRVSLKQAGALQYTVYGGQIQDDTRGGYRYGIEDQGMRFTGDIKSAGFGGDVRWSAPVEGLMVGYSLLRATSETQVFMPLVNMAIDVDVPSWRRQALFSEYQGERIRLAAEWRRDAMTLEFTPQFQPADTLTSHGWFAAGSYRVHDRLELGSYHSRHISNVDLPAGADDNHIFDTAITARVDLNRFWHVKVEGHFVDGYGERAFARGFYNRSNPQGLASTTRLLVVRTGISF